MNRVAHELALSPPRRSSSHTGLLPGSSSSSHADDGVRTDGSGGVGAADSFTEEDAAKAARVALFAQVECGAVVREAPPPLQHLTDALPTGAALPSTRPADARWMVSSASMHQAERRVADAVRRRLAPQQTAVGGVRDRVFGRYRAAFARDAADVPPAAHEGAPRHSDSEWSAAAASPLSGGVAGLLSSLQGAEADGADDAAKTDGAGESGGSGNSADGGGSGVSSDTSAGAARNGVSCPRVQMQAAGGGAADGAPPERVRRAAPPASPLSARQVQAVERAGMNQLMVLTGGPGTGKTYTVQRIVARWRAEGKKVLLACPTARAASVLATAVGAPASTIHRLLEYNPREERYGPHGTPPQWYK
jgi:hypothetical protein